MLAILGLFGAICAGVLADSMMSGDPSEEDDTAEMEEGETHFASNSHGSELPDEDIFNWMNDTGDPAEDGPDSPDLMADEDPARLLTGTPQDDILGGKDGDDTILGAAGNDLLDGREGNDWIQGGNGEDYVNGGAGADSLYGGLGNDVMRGEEGTDLMDGGPGADRLSGHAGADSLVGGTGDDSLLGGDGDDRLEGEEGRDWLSGGFGNDTLVGGAGEDTLDGNAGNDLLIGVDTSAPDAETDYLNGGAGDDRLVLGAGDIGHGGTGADMFEVGDWIEDDGFATIQDYDPAQDELVVVYDAQTHPDPQISLIEDNESGDVTVLLDGFPLAHIPDGAGLQLSQLRLMPSQAA